MRLKLNEFINEIIQYFNMSENEKLLFYVTKIIQNRKFWIIFAMFLNSSRNLMLENSLNCTNLCAYVCSYI